VVQEVALLHQVMALTALKTPPMTTLAKQNEKIRIAKAEIEVAPGDKPKMVSLTELEEEKSKGGNGLSSKGKAPEVKN